MINLKSHLAGGVAAFLLLSLATACGSSSSTTTPVGPPASPTVVSSLPANGAVDVAPNGTVSATFSEAMDPASLTALTFTLTTGGSQVPVAGTVAYASSKATFTPAVILASNVTYAATITTGAMSAMGKPMLLKATWSFTTGSVLAAGLPVNLGAAGNFVILAKSAISTVPPSAVTGNLGVSPAAATYITGFSLTANATNVFSSSPQVTGQIFASDYAAPTPSNLTAAVGDMQLAFTDAAGRAAAVTELGAGNVGGMNLSPGVYKWSSGLLVPTDLTLTGSATDVWIFQIAQDLTLSNAVRINLAGGALAKNVFWQVAGMVSVGTTAHLEGVVLTQTAVTLGTGATVNGRLLAQTAVSLDASTVVQPAP